MTAASVVSIRRHYGHAPARVFAAFSRPDAIQRWLAPRADMHTEVRRFDFREDGRYRFVFTAPDGQRWVAAGVYTEIVSPERLCFSWAWEAPDVHAGVDSMVRVTLRATEGGTELVLEHRALLAPGMASRHQAGWSAALDRLGASLAPANNRRNFTT